MRRSPEPVRYCSARVDPPGFTIQPDIVRREAREGVALIGEPGHAAACRRGHCRVNSSATLLAADTSTCVTA